MGDCIALKMSLTSFQGSGLQRIFDKLLGLKTSFLTLLIRPLDRFAIGHVFQAVSKVVTTDTLEQIVTAHIQPARAIYQLRICVESCPTSNVTSHICFDQGTLGSVGAPQQIQNNSVGAASQTGDFFAH